MTPCVGTNICVQRSMLGLIFECGAESWDRLLVVEQCVRNDIRVWSGVLGQIIVCGAVYWEIYLSMER